VDGGPLDHKEPLQLHPLKQGVEAEEQRAVSGGGGVGAQEAQPRNRSVANVAWTRAPHAPSRTLSRASTDAKTTSTPLASVLKSVAQA
jgi:hypothetical protein